MSVWGVDYSHWQCPPLTARWPDVRAMAAAGVEFVILKAWEGSGPDTTFVRNLHDARAANMPALAYVYLHASDDLNRMLQCFETIGDTVLCLDWEDTATLASVVEAWMDAYEAHAGRRGLAYYGAYPPAEPTARIGQWPRWFPNYADTPRIPPWDGVDAHPDWR